MASVSNRPKVAFRLNYGLLQYDSVPFSKVAK